jgi:electron transfer flavoprotein alpha subunit
MSDNILVFIERRDGEIKRPSLEALGTGRRLADKRGGRLDALAIGPGASDCAEVLAAHGADRLLAVDAEHGQLYAPQLYASCVSLAAEQGDASVVLLAATAMGKDLAPRATARLKTACASDLIEVDIDDDGTVRGKRPVYSGKAYARVATVGAKPAVATLRPNVFPLPTPDPSRKAEVQAIDPPVAAEDLGVRAVRFERPESQEQDVAEASMIVAGGRGLKAAENFALVRELATELDAAVGASRAVVDAGWIPHSYQVGQTGKVVSPTLYVACGISGAIQHLAGMSSSKVIVAINKDPEAPIFSVADYGIVGDLFEVVPALTEAVRKLKSA